MVFLGAPNRKRSKNHEKKRKGLKKGRKIVKMRGKGRRTWVFAPGAVLSRYATDCMALGAA